MSSCQCENCCKFGRALSRAMDSKEVEDPTGKNVRYGHSHDMPQNRVRPDLETQMGYGPPNRMQNLEPGEASDNIGTPLSNVTAGQDSGWQGGRQRGALDPATGRQNRQWSHPNESFHLDKQ